uniref:Uncharacterized protein n=1 Tax=Mycena chlorophos TaxID=658473 RepID=A0ABQ0M910_MYCCL|nr:predicted protein [Mycena chlorophos]
MTTSRRPFSEHRPFHRVSLSGVGHVLVKEATRANESTSFLCWPRLPLHFRSLHTNKDKFGLDQQPVFNLRKLRLLDESLSKLLLLFLGTGTAHRRGQSIVANLVASFCICRATIALALSSGQNQTVEGSKKRGLGASAPPSAATAGYAPVFTVLVDVPRTAWGQTARSLIHLAPHFSIIKRSQNGSPAIPSTHHTLRAPVALTRRRSRRLSRIPYTRST